MAAIVEVYLAGDAEAGGDAETGVCVADGVLRAESFRERLQGLSGKKSLAPGEGCYLEDCRSVHTFTMRLPIDVLFLTGDGLVVDIEHSMAPKKTRSGPRTARDVLELAAGTARRRGIRPGDRLILKEQR